MASCIVPAKNSRIDRTGGRENRKAADLRKPVDLRTPADLQKPADLRTPAPDLNPRISSETFTKEVVEDAQNFSSSSSYTLARESEFSNDVDRWIRGNTSMESTGVQNSRTRLVQRSTLAMAPSLRTSGMWYVLALVLPLFSINPNCTHWRCNPSAVLNTAELLIAHIIAICSRIRNHVRRLAREQVARDVFATTMDAVLVLYALGFLVLSMYQASIIG